MTTQTTQIVERRGLGLCGLLTLLFVAAKLVGLINWSWWMVFIPIWIIPALFVGAMAVIGIGTVLIYVIAWLLDKTGIPKRLNLRRRRKLVEGLQRQFEKRLGR